MIKVDPAKLAKDLASASKQLSKDKKVASIIVGELQRKGIQLKAVNRELTKKNIVATTELDTLQKQITTEKLRLEALQTNNTDLERENGKLDDQLEATKRDLQVTINELDTKKQTLDTELEEYSLARKQEIKDSILEANKELLVVNDQLSIKSIELEAKKTELSELSKVYVDEQSELVTSNEETKRLLEENKQLRAETEQELTDLQREVKQLQFDRDNLKAQMKSDSLKHEQFLDYERKARKILDTKDRELQEKSASITSENQFLENRRSFLPKL